MQNDKKFKKALSIFCNEQIDNMLQFMNDKMGAGGFLPVYRSDDGEKITYHLVESYPKGYSRSPSRAGVHFSKTKGKHLWIRMNLNQFLRNMKKEFDTGEYVETFFTEYEHIRTDPVIGHFNGHWTKDLMGTLAHEVAHMVEHGIVPWGEWYKKGVSENSFTENFNWVPEEHIKNHNPKVGKKTIKGHGIAFQTIYAILREEFVNGHESFQMPALEEVKVRKSKWTVNRRGALARYYLNMKDGSVIHAGHIRTHRTGYSVYSRDGEFIENQDTISGARLILEEDIRYKLSIRKEQTYETKIF